MSVEHRIIDLLRRHERHRFCDACLALELKLSLVEARAAASTMSEVGEVTRGPGTCAVCTRNVETTALAPSPRASAPR